MKRIADKVQVSADVGSIRDDGVFRKTTVRDHPAVFF